MNPHIFRGFGEGFVEYLAGKRESDKTDLSLAGADEVLQIPVIKAASVADTGTG